MIFTETVLPGAFVIDLERREDERGYFARAWCPNEFTAHRLKPVIAQANVAFNRTAGTLRGMHFQFPPAAETKVVRCTRGAIVDIIVDLRPESPTYLEHVAVDGTDTSYFVGEFYTPEAEGGLSPHDPGLGLDWPLPVSAISPKDAEWAALDEVEPEIRRRMETA